MYNKKFFLGSIFKPIILFCLFFLLLFLIPSDAEENYVLRSVSKSSSASVTFTGHGNEVPYQKEHFLGTEGGLVVFKYHMYLLRDTITVQLNGKRIDRSVGAGFGALLGYFLGGWFDTGSVEGSGTYAFNAPSGVENIVTVIANPGGGLPGSGWDYSITFTPGADVGLISGFQGMGQAALDDAANRPGSWHSDPIDTATGAQILQQNLITLWGAQPLPFSISYNSLLTKNSPFGRGWSHNYQGKLEILDPENIGVRWNNGRYNVFKLGQTNKKGKKEIAAKDYRVDGKAEPSARYYRLQANSDNTYTLADRRSKAHWRFDSKGQLIELRNNLNQSIALTYNASNQLASIQEPVSGRQLHFVYNEYGKVSELSDPNTGRKINFAYDNSDLLTNIILANTNVLNYTYNKMGQLERGQDSQGILFQNTYDKEGRIIAQDDGRPETPITRFIYFPERLKKKALKQLFKSENLESALAFLASDSETESPLNQKKRKQREQTTLVLDRNQNLHLYFHNDKLQLLAYIDPEKRLTRYRYDREGNLRSTVYPGHRRIRYYYDGNHQVTEMRPPGLSALKMEYDTQNNLISAQAERKQNHDFDYDASNRLTRYTNPLGHSYQITYTAEGLLQQITKPGGGTRTYTYQQGRPTQIKDAADNLWNIVYDSAGRPITVTDPEGNNTSYTYDEKDRVTSKTDALGNITIYHYDFRGNLIRFQDAEGAVTDFTYTPHKKLASVIDAQSNITYFAYDNEDRLLSATDALGNTTRYEYDAIGRRITTVDPLGNRYKHNYNEIGDFIGTKDPLENNQYHFDYNRQRQVSRMKMADGEEKSFRYDKRGRLIKQNQSRGRSSQYHYDGLHQLIETKTSAKQIAKQTFDPNGNLGSFTDPQDNTTALAYDKADRLTLLKSPSGQSMAYTYNARGLLESVTWPAGQKINLAYDAVGRLETLTEEDGDTTLTYDKVGRPLTTTKNGNSLTRQYDSLGRLIQFTDAASNVISYTYDAVGRLIELTYPKGKTVSYDYDANNRLVSVTDWKGRTTRYTYDKAGRLTETQRPNGSKETRAYQNKEKANLATQLTDTAGGKTLLNYFYRYNDDGQLIEQEGEPESPEYTLTQPIEMSYDSDNQLVNYNGVTLSYDPNGNLLNGPFGAYSYDSRNRLINAEDLIYHYDSENRRIGIESTEGVTQLVHNPNAFLSQLLVRKTPEGKETYYVYGLGLLYEEAEDQVRYYHYDHQGNTLFLTDSIGQITDQLAYSPYGEVLKKEGSTDTPFLYNGRYGIMTDANGLLHMRARYYSPKLHRFLNSDILLGNISDPFSLNRYAYVKGDPINSIDPQGLSSLDMNEINWLSKPSSMSSWLSDFFDFSFYKKSEEALEVLPKEGQLLIKKAQTQIVVGGPPLDMNQVRENVKDSADKLGTFLLLPKIVGGVLHAGDREYAEAILSFIPGPKNKFLNMSLDIAIDEISGYWDKYMNDNSPSGTGLHESAK